MADDYTSDSPYAGDWSAGAFGPPGVIWIGEIPLPRAYELVAQGWEVVGQPLPPIPPVDVAPPPPSDIDIVTPPPPDAETGGVHEAPPDFNVPPGAARPPDVHHDEDVTPDPTQTTAGDPTFPPAYGGPEEPPPPADFDAPPQLEVPTNENTQPPALPPLEGEYIPRADPGESATAPRPVIEGEAESYSYPSRIPGTPSGGVPPLSRQRGIMEKDLAQPRPLYPYGRIPPGIDSPLPPIDVERIILRGIGRIVLGPWGSVLGDALAPEVLGSGEMPFPQIPQVSIPAPAVTLPPLQSWPDEPPVPEIDHPPVPDVMTVTPEDSWPSDPAVPTTTSANAPTMTPLPAPTQTPGPIPWWALLSGLIIGRATRARPGQGLASTPIPRPILPGEINPTTPIPRARADPLTPPAPLPGTDPLTPVDPGLLPSPSTQVADGGYSSLYTPQDTEERRCRCKKCKKCKDKKQRAKRPSDKVAHLLPYNRRMSEYSLENLRRGTRK